MSIEGIRSVPIQKIIATIQVKNRPENISGDSEFNKILVKTATKDTDESFIQLPFLSKADLMKIIEAVHCRMNSRLMRAFSSDVKDEKDIPLASVLDHLIPPGKEASSKRHTEGIHGGFNDNGNYESIINRASEAFGVDPALVRSVIAVESNFNPNSTSPKGAMGLMQLMPATARELGVQNAYDPVENIWAGTRYLKMLADRYEGNINMMLAAYNWGMGNLEKRPAQMPLETRSYIDHVTRHYERAKIS
ncbi:MAG: lytic transglycosylase domain-containing protein [Pseudomonadota bacterium]